MTIKASAGPALILAAALFAVLAGPAPATAAGSDSDSASRSESATPSKSAGQTSRELKKKRYAYRKYTRATSKPAEARKAEEKADASGGAATALPQSVANAYAQMTSTAVASGSARAMSEAMSAKASTILLASADKPAEGQAPSEAAVIASDQLNDVDRALQETPPGQTVAMVAVKPVQDPPAVASNNDSSTLDKTSLIGKIFIAFGALLTMASAARMFMA